jgi:hypothetical protein
MPSAAQRQLLQFLNVQQAADPRRPEVLAARREAQPQTPSLDGDAVAALRARLLAAPNEVLAEAPAVLGDRPQLQDALKLLNDAEAALRTPSHTLSALAANRSDETYELPEQHRFPGYDPAAIPIRPSEKQFESAADALAWAATAVAAWFFRLATRKPDLPAPSSTAEYLLHARNGVTTIALFSDWGTGYYHSRYIARHVVHLGVAQAVHLGDVYYTGTSSQFEEQFTPPLLEVMKAMPLYAMNANHEMDSHGIPYLEFLALKRQLGGETGYSPQPQETSYFCLANDAYQVVGIDTAFFDNGRYKKKILRDWLRARLEHGRDTGKVTVLLSQNEPYGPSGGDSIAARELRDLYTEDLGDWAKEGLIHAWFWGDEHYAALYEPGDEVPFVGSCIGHGGYPYGRMHLDSQSGDVTQAVWAETDARFPEDTGQRQDRGNNGFCVLTFATDGIRLAYWDWLLRKRHEVRLVRDGVRLRIAEA